MRKTQNFLRRAGSAALALTLTVSLCRLCGDQGALLKG